MRDHFPLQMVLHAVYYQNTYANLTAVLLLVSTQIDWMADKSMFEKQFYFTIGHLFFLMAERFCQIDLYQVAVE